MLLLSIFPGIDLLGRAFESEGHCVVRGPDLIWGGDIRTFTPPSGVFHGVIGGSPCQDFSKLRRSPPTGYGMAMLAEFSRVVGAAAPAWYLLENVPGVPTISIPGYQGQRFDLRGTEVGMTQRRLRHFQYGYRSGAMLALPRVNAPSGEMAPVCTASEGSRSNRRNWGEFCASMGLPSDFALPGMSIEARYRAVGNGVPLPMGQFIARAITHAATAPTSTLCVCGCGRPVSGKAFSATAACRKRIERRKRDKPVL
jgi:DNA (cytosine-5)-methyltransferase 1